MLVASVSCASNQAAKFSRSFERSELKDLPLRTVEVVVVATPAVVAGPVLQLSTFSPPTADAPVFVERQNPAMNAALLAQVRLRLERAGYQVLVTGQGRPKAPSKASTVVLTSSTATTTQAMGATSSSALPLSRLVSDTSTASMTPVAKATPRVVLTTQTTLAQILKQSQADAVLVVRAVSADSFQLIRKNAAPQVVVPNQDNSAVQAPVDNELLPRDGRLVFGQAFLFDVQTGLRLWSRHLPDYPNDGRLQQRHPQLKYGYVRGPDEPVLTEEPKSIRASAAFVYQVLKEFPAAQAGKASARAKLGAIDVQAERQMQKRLDGSTISIEIDIGYSGETSGAQAVLDNRLESTIEPLPLSGSAVAPAGVIRFTPRLAYQSPGGYRLHAGIPIGIAPGSFGRSYHRDGSTARPALDARAEISGVVSIGAEAGIAIPFLINAQTQWAPEASLFAESWRLSTSTPGVVTPSSYFRLGLLLGASVSRRLGPDSPLFLRAGVRGRLGFDTTRSAGIIGAELQAGFGYAF